MNKHCQFCTDESLKDRTIYRDELVWVFPTNIPIVPGHVLLCPTRCVETIEELEPKELKALFEMLKKIKSALKKAFGAEGFNVAFNEGKLAGQSVPHVHIHILPRKEGDSGIIEYEPRKFLYRPGSREESPEKEMQDVAKLLSQLL